MGQRRNHRWRSFWKGLVTLEFSRHCLAIYMVAALSPAALADEVSTNLIMPRVLVNVAAKRDCRQFDDFYSDDRANLPAHVYGVLPGPQVGSAAFWCWRNPGESILMFATDGDDGLVYAGEIVFEGAPIGLSVPADFSYPSPEKVTELPDPAGRHPKSSWFEGAAVILGDDESGRVVFFRGGKWYKAWKDW